MPKPSPLPRRDFLKLAGGTAMAAAQLPQAQAQSTSVCLVYDPKDRVAASEPAQRALKRLQLALADRRTAVTVATNRKDAAGSRLAIFLQAGDDRKAHTPATAEGFYMEPTPHAGGSGINVAGADPLGLAYALLELADRVANAGVGGLELHAAVEQAPANRVRSCARAFLSEIEDKPWFYDRAFWTGYLDMLVGHRFNRFNFALGFGYDFPNGVTGDYLHFPYPYLFDVPGFNVTIEPALQPGEQQRNLETLQFIARETAARGMQFQLGLWTHAYAWTKSPHSDHQIHGLTDETQGRYCRDALAMLLKACPQITGVTLRVHGESGVAEGRYDFWRTLFEAFHTAGRPIEIDMHAKGITDVMMKMAAETKNPVKISAKWCAEHQGLPYHQADIRELEIPTPERMETGVFNVSNGARRFTRYGYADLYEQGAPYEVLYRLWPGTQRHLVWADPAMGRGYGETAHFCNAAGMELCEPLTFKGREGSGHPGGREAYADESLKDRQDWAKFEPTYRVWGRCLYNPAATDEELTRSVRQSFGPAGPAMCTALANASRLLPLITHAHMASASNHAYWPEIYTDMPLVAGGLKTPYGDSPKPYCFGTVSPIDPQLFSSPVEYAAELLGAPPPGKTSPIQVVIWLETFAAAAETALGQARTQSPHPADPAFRRYEEDLLIQIGLGRYFAAKMRAAVAWSIYERSMNPDAGQKALALYTAAHDTWAAMARRARLPYVEDVSYGSIPMRRGDWQDRLPAIEQDLALARKRVAEGNAISGTAPDPALVQRALTIVSAKPTVGPIPFAHTPPERFTPGTPLKVSLAGVSAPEATLFYRHVNQAERWRSMPMTPTHRAGNAFEASIPGDYTQSPYPLQWYFSVPATEGRTLLPQWNATLSNQPYYAVWMRG